MEFLRLLPACVLLAVSSQAVAFPTQDDETPGSQQAAWDEKSNAWGRVDLGFFDGSITSTPPDAVKFDRRLETFFDAGFNATFTKRWNVRFDLKVTHSTNRQAEENEPRAVVTSSVTEYSPGLAVSFVTDKGLELFLGATEKIAPGFDETVESAAASSTTTYASNQLKAQHFGVMRRSKAWTGGFYYQQGSHIGRHYSKTASDGTELSGEEQQFVAPSMGVLGEFDAGAGRGDFELDFIQARGYGPTDDKGKTLYTDYFEARFGGWYPLAGAFGLQGGFAHKTLAYSNSAYVTFETMPVTSVNLKAYFGKPDDQHAYAGLIAGYGTDGQSLPEFNAKYKLVSLAVTTGLNFPF